MNTRQLRTRALHLLTWLLPLAAYFSLYWWGMRSWFQQDDFAWLGLPFEVHSSRDIWDVLFGPRAQGTVRPLSERLFFLAFASNFGLDHRPFHICVILTQCANLLLFTWIALRLTKSRPAAVLAPILWLCGVGPATPLSWLSTYNQVLESFFMLAAFACLLRAQDTGKRRWFVLQWAFFLLGFGALETNVVYPAIALLYAFLFARPLIRKIAPMVPAAVIYAVLHFLYAPKPLEGVYARHYDLSVFPTLFRYLGIAFGAGRLPPGSTLPAWTWQAVAWIVGLAVVGWSLLSYRKWGNSLGFFGLGWFLLAIAPMLPLRDHITDYYLMIPGLGLSLTISSVFSVGIPPMRVLSFATVGVLALHLAMVLPLNRAITWWRFERGIRIRVVVEGLERAAQLHPGKMILLTGVESELFWSCLLDEPGRLVGAREVFLAPGEEKRLEDHPELGDLRAHVADPGLAGRALMERSAIVYQLEPNRLRNVTRAYRRQMPQDWVYQRPRLIDAAHPAFASELGEGWYDSEGAQRWMAQKAIVRLPPPRAGDQLYLSCYLPLTSGPRPRLIRVRAGNVEIGTRAVGAAEQGLEALFPIPNTLAGKPLEITLEVDRPFRLDESGTPYGLAFGKIGLR